MMFGGALKLRTFFRFLMNNIGLRVTLHVGLQFSHAREDPSTLYKMGYYSDLTCMGYLILTPSQLTPTYVYLTLYEVILANNYLRIITRLYASVLGRKT
jgi:hypothetical protein